MFSIHNSLTALDTLKITQRSIQQLVTFCVRKSLMARACNHEIREVVAPYDSLYLWPCGLTFSIDFSTASDVTLTFSADDTCFLDLDCWMNRFHRQIVIAQKLKNVVVKSTEPLHGIFSILRSCLQTKFPFCKFKKCLKLESSLETSNCL